MKHGLYDHVSRIVMAVGDIQDYRRENVLEYVAIRQIYLRDEVVVVKLARVTEGRPCFSPSFSRERVFTYEFHRGSTGWVGRLARKALPFSLGRSLIPKP